MQKMISTNTTTIAVVIVLAAAAIFFFGTNYSPFFIAYSQRSVCSGSATTIYTGVTQAEKQSFGLCTSIEGVSKQFRYGLYVVRPVDQIKETLRDLYTTEYLTVPCSGDTQIQAASYTPMQLGTYNVRSLYYTADNYFNGQYYTFTSTDCGQLPWQPTCGDDICSPSENTTTCPHDCIVGYNQQYGKAVSATPTPNACMNYCQYGYASSYPSCACNAPPVIPTATPQPTSTIQPITTPTPNASETPTVTPTPTPGPNVPQCTSTQNLLKNDQGQYYCHENDSIQALLQWDSQFRVQNGLSPIVAIIGVIVIIVAGAYLGRKKNWW